MADSRVGRRRRLRKEKEDINLLEETSAIELQGRTARFRGTEEEKNEGTHER